MDLSHYQLDTLHLNGEFELYRGHATDTNRRPCSILVVMPTSEHPRTECVRMLEHELALGAELDPTWAVRPLALVQHLGRSALVLEDPPAEPLDRLLETLPVGRGGAAIGSGQTAMELGLFLRLAVHLASALREMHRRGIVHKNIKPPHVLINAATGCVWLGGFGIASRLPRERQAPGPPETIAGTLAYMAPEQTGRMNRSIDARTDLYALGITFYEMVTGSLPFIAADAMEWVYCHIARQPIPPRERADQVPNPVSAIIMKLLAKAAEERYQTAAGLERDLRRCQVQLEAEGHIDDFALGERDTPDRLLIPEKLYGRDREIAILLEAFDGIVKGGAPELVLVSGYSGVGKSSVVNELHKVLVPPRGLFAAGKFDQYKRDIPYSTVAQGFQGLVRQLLAKSEDELAHWREALCEALGPNGQLMTDLVPELTLIIGEQAPIAELPPQDAQRRFHLVFRRFLGVFARPEHPLALFLDDLQWLDRATLNLLEDLMRQPDARHLLLIGAYRDNEVTSTHPLMRTLEAIRNTRAPVHEIVIAPLTRGDVACFVADSLYCDRERAAPLADLVHDKTVGNPFFMIQFLTVLADEGLLALDHGAARWVWDLARIHAKGYTDNVVDLVLGKLSRLPIKTQKALQQLACLGNSAEFALLAMVCGDSKQLLECDLEQALRTGLVLSSDGCYRFLHDRVQEAAYSLIPEAERAPAHLRIGRLLLASTAPEKRDEAIFEIVNQLNRGAALIGLRHEKEQLAELNLIAGKRAKSSAAYVAAVGYLAAGTTLLADDGWDQRSDLMFALEFERAECEFLTGEVAAAEARLTLLASRAAKPVDRAMVACLGIELYWQLDKVDRGVEFCLDYFHHLGVDLPAHPGEEDVRAEYERLWSLIGGREIEELIDLPLMQAPESVATLTVLSQAIARVYYFDGNLYPLLVCRALILSIEHGNSDASCLAYVHMCAIAGNRFGNYKAGFRFGRLGCDLIERRGLTKFEARTYHYFGWFSMWTQHLRTSCDWLRRAHDVANKIGDVLCANHSTIDINTYLLAAGDPLLDRLRHAERCLETAEKSRFEFDRQIISPTIQFIRTLRGLTATFGCFNGPQFDEREYERNLSSTALGNACNYWIRKLQARFFAGDYVTAVDASLKAQRLLWTSSAVVKAAEFHFYSALSHAACCDPAFPIQNQQHVEQLSIHYKQIVEWAENCPQNFENRSFLIGAEIARIEGRWLDAERLYEAAIQSAHENEFVHNEAIANELAARFYAGRGYETIAQAYWRNARNCYVRWGADGKVRQLDRFYPHLRSLEADASSTGAIDAPVEQLDLATVIKLSETVSREMVLEKLLDTLMRTAIEHAGAVRALLLLSREGEQRIAAEATTSNDTVTVQLCDVTVSSSLLPESVIRYVLHTRESVILDDAASPHPFSTDPYIAERQARSVLCLPLTNQGKLIGALYLENNLAPGVFSAARATVLKLLASQAAISLENSRLYRDLAERESRIRRLVDANIIGIFIWEIAGGILEANDAFLAIVGYDREDLLAGHLRWTDLTPPEWLERDERRWIPELKASGSLPPFEKEYIRKDGSRVPVLIGAAAFDEAGNRGVAYVLDLTERKRAQEALNKAREELAHVSRITALSALTASVAHEVNQPLSGIITNASTCLRMLTANPPNVAGALETVRRTVRDGTRAAEVVARLRAMFSKREFTLESVNLNEAVREVIALASNELQRNRIILRPDFAPDLPVVTGDRIQLQQVILNLLRNASDAMVDVHDRPRELLIKTGRDESGDQINLSVRDSGIGLPPQILDSLFDAFYTTKSGGMGIGLFVSRAIIERHNGRLWAEANGQSPGATFSLSLPSAALGSAQRLA